MTGSPRISNQATAALELALVPVDIDSLPDWEEKWRLLEERATKFSVYTAYDWLHAWTSVTQPRKLRVSHVVNTHDGSTVSLGLIEIDRVRGWRFAGGAFTPYRAPLCLAGYEDEVWALFAAWLQRHRSAWSTLEAVGVTETAYALPGAQLSDNTVSYLEAPDSFDAYLASMSSRRRHEIRRRLRRTEEMGVEIREVPPDTMHSALTAFQALSTRAKNKDEHLLRLLEHIDSSHSIELHAFEVLEQRRLIGISIDLIYRRVSFPYNLAWNPDSSQLAPGILLTLNTIKYAIEHGLSAIDLGPGSQNYKRSLGFGMKSQSSLYAINHTTWSRMLRAVGIVSHRLRPRPATSR